MSIEDTILDLLFKPRRKYKGVPVSALGIPIFFNMEKRSVSKAFSRLKQKSYIEKNGDLWEILPKGVSYLKNRKVPRTIFDSPFSSSDPKTLLVIFDIPESKKAERDWFRFHLKRFSYIMIQKSVWIGPSPLPRDFTNYVKEIGLKDFMKTLKLAHSYKTGVK